MELANYLKTSLDYYSVIEKLGEIEWKYQDGDHDEYYSDYEDMFSELANGSVFLYEDIESLLSEIRHNLPWRARGDTGIFWFNTAAALIDETDLMLLIENEGIMPLDDEDTEREKRIRSLNSLTKDKAISLLRQVFNLLLRYLKLLQAYEMLCAMVDELRRLHSFRERNGVSELPSSAYVG